MSAKAKPEERKHLQVDALIDKLRERFDTIPDSRVGDHTISLPDALMSGIALFALKEPSLLAFQERIKDSNLRTIYGIQHVPSDTQMRVILDPVEPESLSPCFTDLFRELQRGKALEPFVFYQGWLSARKGDPPGEPGSASKMDPPQPHPFQ